MIELLTILSPLVIGTLIITVLHYRNLWIVADTARIKQITADSKRQLLNHFYKTTKE